MNASVSYGPAIEIVAIPAPTGLLIVMVIPVVTQLRDRLDCHQDQEVVGRVSYGHG